MYKKILIGTIALLAVFTVVTILYLNNKPSPITNSTNLNTSTDIATSTDSLNSPFGVQPAEVIPPSDYNLKNPFEYATDLGVKWNRPDPIFTWDQIQKDDSKDFDWGMADRFVSDSPSSMHIIANIHIGMLDSKKYTTGSFMPKDVEAYKKFVTAVIQRYGDKIKYWQVDNEPPHDRKDYAKFLELTYTTIKSSDPQAKVLIGGVPGMPPSDTYLEKFDATYLPILTELSKTGKKYFDIFDYHWYGNATGDYLGSKKVYDYITKKMTSLGIPYDEVWITENGTYSGDPKYISVLGPIDYAYQTEEQQANDLIKRYVYPISFGVKKIFWAYGIREGFKYDETYFDFTGLVYDGKYKGDLGKGVKKLSYYTYKKMVEKLDGSNWNNIQKIQEKDGIYIYKFTKNGKPIWVAWNDNADSKKIKISTVSSNEVTITEAVPNYSTGKNVTDYSKAFISSLKSPNEEITLSDKPVYIEEGQIDLKNTNTEKPSLSPAPVQDSQQNTVTNVSKNPCGDGICDDFEKAHPDICPADCK